MRSDWQYKKLLVKSIYSCDDIKLKINNRIVVLCMKDEIWSAILLPHVYTINFHADTSQWRRPTLFKTKSYINLIEYHQ